ncbi:MFS transporter, partial [Escherichia coli]|nr:MFS transporter [Escherichia coli]
PLSGALLGLEGIYGLHGWQWLFICIGTPAVLLAWPTLRLLPDGPAKVRWLSDEQRNWLQEQLANDLREFGQTRHGNPLHALKDGRVLLLALFY